MKLQNGEWIVEILPEQPNRVFISRVDKPGAIHINQTEEGYIVDLWPSHYGEVVATCAAEFVDLHGEEEE